MGLRKHPKLLRTSARARGACGWSASPRITLNHLLAVQKKCVSLAAGHGLVSVSGIGTRQDFLLLQAQARIVASVILIVLPVQERIASAAKAQTRSRRVGAI